MEIPPKAARIELWKATFGRSSFIQANRACRAMIAIESSGPEVLISALSTTALVCYARPFKQNTEVKLDKAIVPIEFTDFHEDLILYRDKVVAHRDVKGPETPWGTANNVTFCFKASALEIETTSPILERTAAERLASLCSVLIKLMDDVLNPLVACHLATPLADGRYVLSA